jgi:hypothetical protein
MDWPARASLGSCGFSPAAKNSIANLRRRWVWQRFWRKWAIWVADKPLPRSASSNDTGFQ